MRTVRVYFGQRVRENSRKRVILSLSEEACVAKSSNKQHSRVQFLFSHMEHIS